MTDDRIERFSQLLAKAEAERDEARHALEAIHNIDETIAVDALMSWWLNGSEDPDMREWWSTDDAVESATACVQVILESLGLRPPRRLQEG